MSIITIADWQKHFPFKTVRPEQESAINFIINSLVNDKKRFVICNYATGTGKSAIAVTVSKYFADKVPNELCDPGGYFLTTQKILQEQYIKDFGGSKGTMVSIKSATGYKCKRNPGFSCGDTRRLLKCGTAPTQTSACKMDCVYMNARDKFIRSTLGITNYSYFLSLTKYTDEIENPKQLLILDEAHNLQEEISGFVDIQVTQDLCLKMGFQLPRLTDKETAFKWLCRKFQPAMSAYVKELENEMAENEAIASDFTFMDKLLCKLNRSIELYTDDNWIMNFIDSDDSAKMRIEFKPIDISQYTEDSLFNLGKAIILMSATILDPYKFAEQVGIPSDRFAHMKIESPFAAENKPIIYAPMGRMTMDSIEYTLPKIAKAVQAILKRHPDMKGIIHCRSYKILNYLKDNLIDKRLLFQDDKNREKIMAKHVTSIVPTFLVSPSMSEGVDLKDDLSRVQIVCKLPFPYLGDQLIQKRKEKWSWWYNYETAKTLIQMFGRSVRNEEDYAITYILDESWERFYQMNAYLFPSDFKKQFK